MVQVSKLTKGTDVQSNGRRVKFINSKQNPINVSLSAKSNTFEVTSEELDFRPKDMQ